jgi:ACS family hexuronate transporter-like MFS transporter
MVPAAERGLAGGFFNMGASLGSMLAAPLVAWAILTHSWQFAFVLTGVIWTRLGRPLAGVLSISLEAQGALDRRNANYILSGQESHLAGEGKPSFSTILASGTSGASPSRGSLRIRRGAL